MAFTIVGTGDTSGSSSTQSLAVPAGTSDQDLVLLFVQTENATAQAATPTGFTLIGDKLATGQPMRVTAFRKIAGASEPSSYSITGGPSTNWMQPSIIVIRGESTTTPVEASTSNQGTGTSVSDTSITTTNADLLVSFTSIWNGGESLTTPTGFTRRLNDVGADMFIDTLAQSSPGSSGTVARTIGASDSWVSWLVAVEPAGSSIIVTAGGSGGLQASNVVVSSAINMGGSGGLTAQVSTIASVSLGGSGGLSASYDTTTGTIQMGNSGGLTATGLSSVIADIIPVGGSGGIVASANTLSPGATMGDAGGGIAPRSGAVTSQATLGGAGGIAPISLAPGISVMLGGASGGVLPLKPVINLLSRNQSSFEIDTSGILTGLGAAGSATLDATTSVYGTNSLKVHTDGTSTFQFITLPINALAYAPGDVYVMSMFAKTDTVTPTVRFYCQADQNLPTNIRVGGANTATLSTAFQRFSFSVQIPDPNPYVTIGIRVDTGGAAQAINIWIDGLEITHSSGTFTDWILGSGDFLTFPGGDAGMSVFGTSISQSDIIPMGTSLQDGLAASNVTNNTPLPMGGSGGIPAIASVVRSGAINLGAASPGGIKPPGSAVSTSTITLGNTSTGIAPTTLVSAPNPIMGGSGGLLVTALVIFRVRAVMGQSDSGSGVNPFYSHRGYPSGYWVTVNVHIWRETSPGSGVFQWKPCPMAVWRPTGWKQLTT